MHMCSRLWALGGGGGGGGGGGTDLRHCPGRLHYLVKTYNEQVLYTETHLYTDILPDVHSPILVYSVHSLSGCHDACSLAA